MTPDRAQAILEAAFAADADIEVCRSDEPLRPPTLGVTDRLDRKGDPIIAGIVAARYERGPRLVGESARAILNGLAIKEAG